MWIVIYYLLLFEMSLLALLMLPLPLRLRSMIMAIFRSAFKLTWFRYALWVVAVLVLALGVTTQLDSQKILARKHKDTISGTRIMALDTRYFRDQRNVYLCGAADFMLLLLWGYHRLLKELEKLQEEEAQPHSSPPTAKAK